MKSTESRVQSNRANSESAFDRACIRIPGGVNSPARSFRGVGGRPFFVESGSGAYIRDVDGNSYVDFVLSWGPLILGHASEAVVSAVQAQIKRGSSYGAPTLAETELA